MLIDGLSGFFAHVIDVIVILLSITAAADGLNIYIDVTNGERSATACAAVASSSAAGVQSWCFPRIDGAVAQAFKTNSPLLSMVGMLSERLVRGPLT